TGQPQGRPRKLAGVAVQARIRRATRGLEGAFARGRLTASEQRRYDALAVTVAQLPETFSVESIADVIGWKPNAVYRLRRKGQQMQNNSPKGEGIYWGFRGWNRQYRSSPGKGCPPGFFFSPPASRNTAASLTTIGRESDGEHDPGDRDVHD